MNWEELFPPFGLSIYLGDLEMHPVRYDDIIPLLDLIADGIVSPDIPNEPLSVPFAQGEDHILRRQASMRFWMQHWVEMTPYRWTLPMSVLRGGELVGVQEISAVDFQILRSAKSGSWLGVAHQGKGTGKLMRQALAMFAFDHLGARELHSGAFHDNHRSIAVSRGVGYRENGRGLLARANGEVDEELQFRLVPQNLVRPSLQLRVEGLQPFLDFLGLGKNIWDTD